MIFFLLMASVTYFALISAILAELGRDSLSLLHIVSVGVLAHSRGVQVGVACQLGASVSFPVGLSVDCLSFLMAWWLGSKHEHCKRQK